MIDIENKVFDTVRTAVKAVDASVSCYGEYVAQVASFPCVVLTEQSNTTVNKTRDSNGIEHHVEVVYVCNVYTNDVNGKKASCKALADAVDNAMNGLHFMRTFREQTPNLDRTIYRITMRYRAIVGEGKTDGDNTVYQIYQ